MVVSFYFHHLSTMWFFLSSTLCDFPWHFLFLQCGFFYLCLIYFQIHHAFVSCKGLCPYPFFHCNIYIRSGLCPYCSPESFEFHRTCNPPYTLTGCNQIGFSNQGVFVEAAIFDPATSFVSVYNPLVVNQGSKVGTDFITPVSVTVPKGVTVGI